MNIGSEANRLREELSCLHKANSSRLNERFENFNKISLGKKKRFSVNVNVKRKKLFSRAVRVLLA